MTLLQKRDAEREQQRWQLFDRTRAELRACLGAVLPGSRVVLYGSLVQRGRFNATSDIDLALFENPAGRDVCAVAVQIEERMRRSVDLVLLEKTRLKEKILREGETWTT